MVKGFRLGVVDGVDGVRYGYKGDYQVSFNHKFMDKHISKKLRILIRINEMSNSGLIHKRKEFIARYIDYCSDIAKPGTLRAYWNSFLRDGWILRCKSRGYYLINPYVFNYGKNFLYVLAKAMGEIFGEQYEVKGDRILRKNSDGNRYNIVHFEQIEKAFSMDTVNPEKGEIRFRDKMFLKEDELTDVSELEEVEDDE